MVSSVESWDRGVGGGAEESEGMRRFICGGQPTVSRSKDMS